ncbi:MAG: MFS transporter [Polyangiaceae bacterium]|jgi:MFS family permease
MADVRSLSRALKHTNFRYFFAGQLVSLVGTWMQSVAQSWLVYRLTGSTLLLGLVGFCGQIPVFFFGAFGGVVADRFRRHRILLATQSTMMLLAFVLAGLTLTGEVSVTQIFVLASLLGVANAFDIPARQSFIPQMVSREDLVNAIALNSSMVTGARVVGPALAGITVAAIGEGWCFFANGVSFLAVLGGLLAMRNLPAKTPAPTGSSVARILDGFRFVVQTPPVFALLALLGLVSLMGVPYTVLMPAIVDRVLHGNARDLGILMGFSGGGALLGALALATRVGVQGLGRWVWGAAGLFGASLIAFSLSRTFWLCAALLVPTGFGFMVQMASTNTLVQSMTPDGMRGRVMAAYSMMFMGMAPIGALLAGTMAARIGSMATVSFGGAFCILGAFVFARQRRRLRAATRELIASLEAARREPAAAGGGGPTPGAHRPTP